MKVEIGNYPEGSDDRVVDVHIDDFDVWNMDHTLALIIVPMLKKLKEVKHSSPGIEDLDVPEEFRATNCVPPADEYEADCNWHRRWEWVLDEMIFAFSSYEDDWESQFHHGDAVYIHIPLDENHNPIPEGSDIKPKWYQMKQENDDYWFDSEGYNEYQERISKGFKLFGKYYQGLWD